MSTLKQAPLIEAILELRWGRSEREDGVNVVQLHFSEDDVALFQGQFKAEAKANGYVVQEPVRHGESVGQIPHSVSYRYRKKTNEWPCLQTGLGVFTVNQVNDGYAWGSFIESINEGLRILDGGHPEGISGLPELVVDLRYQDGFIFLDNETPQAFLEEKLSIDFKLSDSFLDGENVGEGIKRTAINFEVPLVKPAGSVVVSLSTGHINGKPGFVMNTIIRSLSGSDAFQQDVDGLVAWCRDAHQVQKHAFDTLIEPAFKKEME